LFPALHLVMWHPHSNHIFHSQHGPHHYSLQRNVFTNLPFLLLATFDIFNLFQSCGIGFQLFLHKICL
jgi:hypothetical protein